MKSIKSIFLSIVASALPVSALALEMQPTAPGGPGGQRSFDLQSIGGYITGAMGFVFGIIAVIMFIVAGILFLTAQGNPEKIQQARNAFMWGVVGVIVGIIAFSIVSIVLSILGGGTSGIFG